MSDGMAADRFGPPADMFRGCFETVPNLRAKNRERFNRVGRELDRLPRDDGNRRSFVAEECGTL
jgi:hypothetical protein